MILKYEKDFEFVTAVDIESAVGIIPEGSIAVIAQIDAKDKQYCYGLHSTDLEYFINPTSTALIWISEAELEEILATGTPEPERDPSVVDFIQLKATRTIYKGNSSKILLKKGSLVYVELDIWEKQQPLNWVPVTIDNIIHNLHPSAFKEN